MTTVSKTMNAVMRKWAVGITCAASVLISGATDGHFNAAQAAKHKIIVLKQHNVSRSGVMMKSKSHVKYSSRNKKNHSNRSGVIVGKRKLGNVSVLPNAVSSKTSSKSYNQRRNRIAIRNELIRRNNLQRRTERRLNRNGDVPTVLVFDETSDNIVTVGQRRPVLCPANHNCGTRLYNDNSGPRIIQLDRGAGNEVGYSNGPKVIRLN